MPKQTQVKQTKKVTSKRSTKKIAKPKKTTLKKGRKSKNVDPQYSIAEKDLVSLPAIDMNAPEEEIIPKIMKMFQGVGFLHLKNLKGFDEDELLKTIKQFHALPDSVKDKLKPKHRNKANSNIYRGWFPFEDNDVSHKEFFDMGAPYDEISEY